MTLPNDDSLLLELARVKAVFQARTLEMILRAQPLETRPASVSASEPDRDPPAQIK